MSHNLALLPKDEMDKVNVDLLASGVAFKERYNIAIIAEAVEREQPEHLRDYFRERLVYYRQLSQNFARMPYEPRNR
ncbi:MULTISPECIES: DNA polymerase III subunit theta [Providencia]|uniref:DNA polymerase III subunit theta n=1 Tax=Providencia TaxID=586 RepID=UPI00029C40EA|nr:MULTISPECIES: DNA polymerase III subunit theta [Providencia]EJD6377625.1 DNA polymerase III subunit theta [Providencia rettgeri]EJF7712519.1 DNA polymerase III subunit theta [Providencia rettgeri]EKT56985.1 DNA polymerase III subunit theta [Providencia rettgeri Dmel1]ELR5117521.1 DNA polymerase III subunit theta [Providencia rettgeri]MBI6200549.1 DNA polymerase III subunit theta [Providencia rettgeri]